MAESSASDASGRILVVEDDLSVTSLLAIGLRREGFIVEAVHNGIDAEAVIADGRFDALIVDWMIPGQDGPTLIRRVRAIGDDVPVLMLTARTGIEQLMAGLDSGADDYLTKPFSFRELVARLRALLRRAYTRDQFHLEKGPFCFDRRRKAVSFNGDDIDLRTKEYEILELLAVRSDQDVSRDDIASSVWRRSLAEVGETTLNMTVSTLRQKLDRAGAGPLVTIQTVRGVGYRMEAANAESTLARTPGQRPAG